MYFTPSFSRLSENEKWPEVNNKEGQTSCKLVCVHAPLPLPRHSVSISLNKLCAAKQSTSLGEYAACWAQALEGFKETANISISLVVKKHLNVSNPLNFNGY